MDHSDTAFQSTSTPSLAALPATAMRRASQAVHRFFNQPVFIDINQPYAEAMHYPQADRLTIQILWLHVLFLFGLVMLNAQLRIPQLIPSPFGWRVITPTEAVIVMAIGLVAVVTPIILHTRLSNHYLWRIIVACSLLCFSYLFIYTSGGAIEMHYHFLLAITYMAIYADWRIGWIMFAILGLQHLVIDLFIPNWLYFYGFNELSPILNLLFLMTIALFTTVICRNYRYAVEALVLAKDRNDQFLAIASHELKTPLTSMKGYVEIVIRKMKRTADPSLEYMNKVDDQLTKVVSMVRDLLDISVRQSGQVEIRPEPVSIESIVMQAIEDQQANAHKHRIEVQGNLRIMIEGDRIRLGQLMNNLIGNAIKYSPQADKVVVKVASARDRVIISVQDFGIGISQAERIRIFEPYFRGNDTQRTNVPGGLGMGLYISDEIVRRHHGRLWVESSPGKGSTFSFMLPLPRPAGLRGNLPLIRPTNLPSEAAS